MGGYYVSSSYTTCRQETILNPGGSIPMGACKCHYKEQKNICVYDAYEGSCCWCTLYLVAIIGNDPDRAYNSAIPLLDQTNHAFLIAECGDGNWKVEMIPENNIGFAGQGTLHINPNFGDYTDQNWFVRTPLGQVSCSQVKKVLGPQPQSQKSHHWTCGANCHDYARLFADLIKDSCP